MLLGNLKLCDKACGVNWKNKVQNKGMGQLYLVKEIVLHPCGKARSRSQKPEAIRGQAEHKMLLDLRQLYSVLSVEYY